MRTVTCVHTEAQASALYTIHDWMLTYKAFQAHTKNTNISFFTNQHPPQT